MQAKNTKSLFHFLTEVMSRLSDGEISVEEAKAQAIVAQQANNILKYELERARLLMQLDIHNQNQNFKRLELREAESTAFDKTNV